MFLTWDIDYFLVHIQEGVLCFFTSLAQRVNLQRDNKRKRLIVSRGTASPKHGAHSFGSGGPADCIQSLSVLTVRRYVARNQSCFDSGCVGVAFPRSRLSCSADDGRLSFVACPCTSTPPCTPHPTPPHQPVLQCVCVCARARVHSVLSGRSVGVCTRSPHTHTHAPSAPPAR